MNGIFSTNIENHTHFGVGSEITIIVFSFFTSQYVFGLQMTDINVERSL